MSRCSHKLGLKKVHQGLDMFMHDFLRLHCSYFDWFITFIFTINHFQSLVHKLSRVTAGPSTLNFLMFIHKLQTSCISWLSRFSGSLWGPPAPFLSVLSGLSLQQPSCCAWLCLQFIHWIRILIHFAAHSNTSFNPNKWGELQSKAKSLVWAALGVVGLCEKLIEEYLVCEMLQLSQQTSHSHPPPPLGRFWGVFKVRSAHSRRGSLSSSRLSRLTCLSLLGDVITRWQAWQATGLSANTACA